MLITNPSGEAMRTVMHEFAVLRKKLEDEIEQIREQEIFSENEVSRLRNHLLQMARLLEVTHLSRTAPVSSPLRLDWIRERFLRSLPDEKRYELEYADREFTLKDGFDDDVPWREVAGWLLGNIVTPEFSTAWMTVRVVLPDSDLEKLDSIQVDMEGSAYFYDPDGDNWSWITLIQDMTFHHVSLIQQTKGLFTVPFLITSADYDRINASFDAFPEYNYAAKIAGKSICDSAETTDATTTQDLDGEPNSDGYVRNPADKTAYVSKQDVIFRHTVTTFDVNERIVTRILSNYVKNRVRWTRPVSKTTGKPHPRRLSIHLVDWQQFVDRSLKGNFADENEECDTLQSPAEIRRRAAEIRRSKTERLAGN